MFATTPSFMLASSLKCFNCFVPLCFAHCYVRMDKGCKNNSRGVMAGGRGHGGTILIIKFECGCWLLLTDLLNQKFKKSGTTTNTFCFPCHSEFCPCHSENDNALEDIIALIVNPLPENSYAVPLPRITTKEAPWKCPCSIFLGVNSSDGQQHVIHIRLPCQEKNLDSPTRVETLSLYGILNKNEFLFPRAHAICLPSTEKKKLMKLSKVMI